MSSTTHPGGATGASTSTSASSTSPALSFRSAFTTSPPSWGDLQQHLQLAPGAEQRDGLGAVVEREVAGEHRLGVEPTGDDHLDCSRKIGARVDARADDGELLERRGLQVDGGGTAVDADDDDAAAGVARLRPPPRG